MDDPTVMPLLNVMWDLTSLPSLKTILLCLLIELCIPDEEPGFGNKMLWTTCVSKFIFALLWVIAAEFCILEGAFNDESVSSLNLVIVLGFEAFTKPFTLKLNTPGAIFFCNGPLLWLATLTLFNTSDGSTTPGEPAVCFSFKWVCNFVCIWFTASACLAALCNSWRLGSLVPLSCCTCEFALTCFITTPGLRFCDWVNPTLHVFAEELELPIFSSLFDSVGRLR